jgi:hypothetical protein
MPSRRQGPSHPLVRGAAAVPELRGLVASHRDSGNRDAACAICHKVDGPGNGPDPAAPSCFTDSRRPDPAAPSCFTDSRNGTSCHANGPGNANHSVPFLGTAHIAVTQTGFDGNCTNCHAVTGTSPLSSAPLCTICHQAGSSLAQANCTSCHAKPPVGSVYPDVAWEACTRTSPAGTPSTMR